jgi:purine-binding chemotaxis protein CheW
MEQLLTFLIGADEYGISVARVHEIAEYRPLTPVPMLPEWMRGVMNLRGKVVPVVDLAAKLGLCLIILDIENAGEPMVIAVMVDAVRRVVDIETADIQEAPPFGMLVDVVPGIVRVDGTLIVLLDLAGIVGDQELSGTAQLLPAMREAAEAADARV